MPIFSQTEASQLPEFMQGPFRNLTARAEAESIKPYEPYASTQPGQAPHPLPRVAPIPEDIKEAHRMGRDIGIPYSHLGMAANQTMRSDAPFHTQYEKYMHPFEQHVLTKIAKEGKRTLKHDILPALEAKFVGLGQHGGSKHVKMAERAARKLQKDILERQNLAMAQHYQQAAQIFNADQTRQLEAAQQLANLGMTEQAAHLADIATLESQGRYQQQQEQAQLDTQYQDWMRQKEHAWLQMQRLMSLMHGIPAPTMQQAFYQAPATPQMNLAGGVGQLAGNILAARMAAGNR